MDESKKKVSRWKILLLGLLIVAFIILLILTFTKNCREDKVCFSEAFSKCMKAKVVSVDDGNKYLYEIQGSQEDSCVIAVHIQEMEMNVSTTIKERLTGKGMVCEVPSNVDIYNTKELSAYCTGPLKEALLQMTVEKLYGFIIKTFGQVVVQESLDDTLPYNILKG